MQYLHPIVNFPCMYSNIQAVPQVLSECCYTYTESSQWDAGTAWMLLYIHEKFTMGWSIATFRQYLHPIVNFPCMYSNIQTVPASHCELSMTAWMLLYIHGKFTMGCRYCLNVVIDTWKDYNTFSHYLHPIGNFPCIYNNIQAVPASNCKLSMYL
jgi:formylglycine-generating enzyme required for sulfatase activity